MNQIIINCNTSGESVISPFDISEGVQFILVNNKQTPLAWYEFNSRQLEIIKIITSQNVKLCFIDYEKYIKILPDDNTFYIISNSSNPLWFRY